MPEYWGKQIFAHRSFPEVGKDGERGEKKIVYFFFRKKMKITPQNIFFLHISSSYAKMLGKTNCQPQEFPQIGSKAKDGKE